MLIPRVATPKMVNTRGESPCVGFGGFVSWKFWTCGFVRLAVVAASLWLAELVDGSWRRENM